MSLTPRMPELRALEALLAVAHAGSLNGAAGELGVTQQAVSARIASLESLTGVQLVARSSHGSQLTSNGVVAAEWADRLLRVAEEVDAGLASLRSERRTRIRISASLTVAEHLLPGWLVSWQRAARQSGAPRPEAVLTATNSDHVVEQVRAGAADLGFIEGPSAPRGLRSRVVAQDELLVVVPPGHPWARRSRPLTAAELDRTPLVTREAGSGTRDALTVALRAALGPSAGRTAPVLELSTAASIRAAVLADAGPAVMSRLAIGDDVADQRLVAVPVAALELRRDLRAVWSGPRTPPAGALRDLLTHVAARADVLVGL